MKPRNPVHFLNTAENKFKAASVALDTSEDKGPGLGLGLAPGLELAPGLVPGQDRRRSSTGLGIGLGLERRLSASVGGEGSSVVSAVAFKDTEKKVIAQVG